MLTVATLDASLQRSLAASAASAMPTRAFTLCILQVKRAQDTRLELFEADPRGMGWRNGQAGCDGKRFSVGLILATCKAWRCWIAIVTLPAQRPDTQPLAGNARAWHCQGMAGRGQRMAGQSRLPHLCNLLRRNPGQQVDPMVKHGSQGHAQCCRAQLPGPDTRRQLWRLPRMLVAGCFPRYLSRSLMETRHENP